MQNYFQTRKLEIGVDEAGRGPAFGRVYTAAVVWPQEPVAGDEQVIDSKQVSKSRMAAAARWVRERARYWAVNYAEVEEIAEHGILQATMQSMSRAIKEVMVKTNDAEFQVLVDGNYFPNSLLGEDWLSRTTVMTVVGGDHTYRSIAAASILAKYERDQYVLELCQRFPELDRRYGLVSNKGYLARVHLNGLQEHGYTQWHRAGWKNFVGLRYNPISIPTKIRVRFR
jgi:ribonuclease HII